MRHAEWRRDVWGEGANGWPPGPAVRCERFQSNSVCDCPYLATKKKPLDNKSSTAGGSRSQTHMRLSWHYVWLNNELMERMQILMTSISKQLLRYVDERLMQLRDHLDLQRDNSCWTHRSCHKSEFLDKSKTTIWRALHR